jgi:hypothetical protein
MADRRDDGRTRIGHRAPDRAEGAERSGPAPDALPERARADRAAAARIERAPRLVALERPDLAGPRSPRPAPRIGRERAPAAVHPDPERASEVPEDAALDVLPVRGVLGWFQRSGQAAVWRSGLAAFAAWFITLAPLLRTERASVLVRVLALLAVLPALGGPLLLLRDPRRARQVGLGAFPAVALLTWTLASFDGALGVIDAFRGALGALAWGVLALGWSQPWSLPDAALRTAPLGPTRGLAPRRRVPGAAVAVAVVGAVAAVGCLGLAWLVTSPPRAVLAHALATACAVALLTAAAGVAVLVGQEPARLAQLGRRLGRDRRLLRLVLLLFVAVLAFAVVHLRD